MLKSASIKWNPVVFMILFHVGAICAVFFLTWRMALLLIVLWYLSDSLGVGITFHRMITHKGLKSPKWVEYTLAFLACLSLQGSPVRWVATHLLHHAKTDTTMDPHSPKAGFGHAHIGWMIFRNPTLDGNELLKKYAPHLMEQRFYRLLHHAWWVPAIIVGVVLLAFAGVPAVLTFVLKTVFGWHTTWFVNSACHTWGSRRFTDTGEDSRNTWWVALLTFGEGWHNNHHAKQVSARHGIAWYEIDINWWGICILKWLGLATAIKKY